MWWLILGGLLWIAAALILGACWAAAGRNLDKWKD